MLGLLPLAGLVFLSGEFGVYATATAEGRVGKAPVQAREEPRWGVVGAITPVLELEYERPDQQVILDYGPRILWRQPNVVKTNKALVLHVVNLSVTLDLNPRLRLIERASASYGEADYSSLAQIFRGQAQVPQVLDIFALSAGTGLRWDASRIWRYEGMFDVEHREVVGTTTPPGPTPPTPDPLTPDTSFRQTNLTLDASGIARVNRLHDLVITGEVSDRILHNGVDVLAVTPLVGWRARPTRSLELRAAVGATYAQDRGSFRIIPGGSIVRPVGNAEVSGLLLGRAGVALRGTLGLTLDYFVDPFLRAAGPRAVVIARSLLLLEPSWTVGIEGSFATSLREKALIGNPDETTIALALPVRHRISDSLIAEAGLRWSVRAPFIRADDITFHERQTWFYVALTASTRKIAPWIAPRDQPVDTRDEGVFARPQTTDTLPQSIENVQETDTGTAQPQPGNVGP